MKGLIKAFNGMGLLLKLIFALPGLDILWNIYRLARSIDKGNIIGIILAVLLIVIGWSFLWIIDIITILLKGTVLWID